MQGTLFLTFDLLGDGGDGGHRGKLLLPLTVQRGEAAAVGGDGGPLRLAALTTATVGMLLSAFFSVALFVVTLLRHRLTVCGGLLVPHESGFTNTLF